MVGAAEGEDCKIFQKQVDKQVDVLQCPSGRFKNDWRLITFKLKLIGLRIFLTRLQLSGLN